MCMWHVNFRYSNHVGIVLHIDVGDVAFTQGKRTLTSSAKVRSELHFNIPTLWTGCEASGTDVRLRTQTCIYC